MTERFVLITLLGLNAARDLSRREILLIPTAAAAAAGVLWNVPGGHLSAASVLIGMLPGGFLLILSRLSGGQIGFGDGILILACGCWLGFPKILSVVCAGFFLASAGAVVLLAVRRIRQPEKGRAGGKQRERGASKSISVPFAPYLFAAYLFAALIGH